MEKEIVQGGEERMKELKPVVSTLERSLQVKLFELRSVANKVLHGLGKMEETMKDQKDLNLNQDAINLQKGTRQDCLTLKNALEQLGQKIDCVQECLEIPTENFVREINGLELGLVGGTPPKKKICIFQGKGQEESAIGGNMNPLNIHEIVAIIVSYIDDIQDLKNIRTLSTTWVKESLHKWRNSAVFVINYETIPVLVKAFCDDLVDLPEHEKTEALALKDPLRLKKIPFKKYRFAKSQCWTYPLEDDNDADFEKRLIFDKCINPNATYLDVGECIFTYFKHHLAGTSYLPGLRWILHHSSNVTEFALAPLIPSDADWRDIALDRYDKVPDWPFPVWFERKFEAPQINTLICCTSQNKTTTGLVNMFGDIDFYSSEDLFVMLPNLKTLQLPTNVADYFIKAISYVTRMKDNFRLKALDALRVQDNEDCFGDWNKKFFGSISRYLSDCKDSLQELSLPLTFEDCIGDWEEPYWSPSSLNFVQDTLKKLEFKVDCEKYPESEVPENPSFFLGDCHFPNLTHFKVQLDYKTFYGKLVTFDFNSLKKMPLLQQFYFGSKDCVDKSWVTEKMDFVEVDEAANNGTFEDCDLPYLKSFHFHGNFTKEALGHLGRIMKNIKTLELVFDQENCGVVRDIWPHLRKLKLLPCSDVPDEIISKLKSPWLELVDESKNWSPAVVKIAQESEEESE